MVAGDVPHNEDELAELAGAVAELQIATDGLDAAAAGFLGVNRTDLRLLSLLDARGRASAGDLAAALRITPASTTAAIQRLAAHELVTRDEDPLDRRRAVVRLSRRARALVARLYAPIAEDGMTALGGFTPAEREVIHRFLEVSRELQSRHAERIRGLTVRGSRGRAAVPRADRE